MKIAFITTDLASGGAQRVISILANKFYDTGNDVTVIAIQGHKVKYRINDEIKYIPIITNYNNRIFRKIERTVVLRNILKKVLPDVIVSFETENNLYSIICSLGLNCKLIISERNDPFNDPKSILARFMRKVLYKYADGFVFQTKDAMEYFTEYISSKGIIIPNPVNEDFFLDRVIGARRHEIVNVCRLAEQKNLKLFIDVIKKINEKYPDYKGVIYGDGPELKSLLEYTNSNNVDSVEFRGFKENIQYDILDSCVFLSTSSYEGISNSIIEAMTLGLAVVASDCPIGGTRMAIRNMYNGILFNVNDFDGAVAAVTYFIENPSEIDRMGNNALEIRNEWSCEKIYNSWVRYIDNILKN